MKKLYLKKNWVDKFQDNINGRNRVTIGWEVDFSYLPQMQKLLELIEATMKAQDWNDIDPSLTYADSRHYSFEFVTTAWVKVKNGDKYNDMIGYQLAMIKAQRKALRIYNRIINTIYYKICQYFTDPLEAIQHRAEDIDLWLERKFDKRVKEFN